MASEAGLVDVRCERGLASNSCLGGRRLPLTWVMAYHCWRVHRGTGCVQSAGLSEVHRGAWKGIAVQWRTAWSEGCMVLVLAKGCMVHMVWLYSRRPVPAVGRPERHSGLDLMVGSLALLAPSQPPRMLGSALSTCAIQMQYTNTK